MRILVIGGTRFIGPYVVRDLLAAGHQVAVFHRGETESELAAGAQPIRGDRRELARFANEFRQFGPEVVLDMIAFNEREARELVRVFKGLAARLVVVSSMDVYRAYGGLLRLEECAPAQLPLAEDAPLRTALFPRRAQAQGPDDWLYHYEKILVERAVRSDERARATVLRLPAVYGPGDRQQRTFEHLRRMDDGRPTILLEAGRARWRWTRGYVEDVAAAIALAVMDERAAGRIYNVGESAASTEAEWVRRIAAAAGWDGAVVAAPRESLPEHLRADLDWSCHLDVDTSRIRRELGYAETVAPAEAMRRTVAWQRAHPPAEIDPRQFNYAAEDAALKSSAEGWKITDESPLTKLER